MIRFNSNATVLINNQSEPVGTRIFGPVPRELQGQESREDHLARAGGALMAAKIKKGDRVIVTAGRDKGKRGEVRQVMPDNGRAIVAGVNLVRPPYAPDGADRRRDYQQGIDDPSVELGDSRSARPASPRVSVLRFSTTAGRCASPKVPET